MLRLGRSVVPPSASVSCPFRAGRRPPTPLRAVWVAGTFVLRCGRAPAPAPGGDDVRDTFRARADSGWLGSGRRAGWTATASNRLDRPGLVDRWLRGMDRLPPRGARSVSSAQRHGRIAALGLAVLFSTTPAEAANRRSFLFGGEAAVSAGALSARATGTDALFYNPAGLASGVRNGLNLSLTAFTYRLSPVEDGVVFRYPDRSEGFDFDASEFLPTPAALVFARPLSERWGLALGAFVVDVRDVRFEVQSERTDVPPDGAAVRAGRSAQTIRRRYNLGAGVGFRANSQLRLGASLLAVYDRNRQNVRFFSSVRDPDGTARSFLEGSNSDVNSLALLPSLALQWSPLTRLDLGVMLRLPTLSIYSWGERIPTLSAPARDGQRIETGVTEFSEFNVQVVEPSSLELMVRHVVGRWTWGATLEVVPPISQGGIIPLDFDVLWNVRAGAELELAKQVEVGLGFFTDLAPNEDAEGQALDSGVDYLGWTTGVRFRNPLNPEGTVAIHTSLGLSYLLGIGSVEGFEVNPLSPGASVSTPAVGVTFHELSFNLATELAF